MTPDRSFNMTGTHSSSGAKFEQVVPVSESAWRPKPARANEFGVDSWASPAAYKATSQSTGGWASASLLTTSSISLAPWKSR